ncbi:MAG: class I SAM-dependent methyltransferase [Candidatus Paceibacterota bacterium]|jgi:23S rRNA (cytosine1962-C5)-methyltransferase
MNDAFVKITKSEAGYELLDSGEGEKLERYGSVLMSRPDPQALWHKNLDKKVWQNVHARFVNKEGKVGWEAGADIPKKWMMEFGGLKFWIKPTAFKHTGIFPEQLENWNWMRGIIKSAVSKGRPVSVLNLFGYTGGATLAAAQAGASVCHLDASKVAISWGKENADISGLSDKPIRWILDDAVDFVQREIRRGNKYDGIVMDPPSFGHGPDGQVWKIEKSLLPFLDDCKKLLSEDSLFVLVNGYAAGYSSLAYRNSLHGIVADFPGVGKDIESGELAIEESKSGRLLPCGIFARWQSKE